MDEFNSSQPSIEEEKERGGGRYVGIIKLCLPPPPPPPHPDRPSCLSVCLSALYVRGEPHSFASLPGCQVNWFQINKISDCSWPKRKSEEGRNRRKRERDRHAHILIRLMQRRRRHLARSLGDSLGVCSCNTRTCQRRTYERSRRREQALWHRAAIAGPIQKWIHSERRDRERERNGERQWSHRTYRASCNNVGQTHPHTHEEAYIISCRSSLPWQILGFIRDSKESFFDGNPTTRNYVTKARQIHNV